MRADFIAALADLAAADDRIVLLTADLGFTVIEGFADRFPSRYYNVGVAETNMTNLATGLASEGMLPFCYSIAAFLSMRCYEAFRDGPVAHDLPVRLVAVGGGVGYGASGITHYALEDVALMRSSGRVSIFAPPTSDACVRVLQVTYAHHGPIYYRLAKDPIIDSRLPTESLATVGYYRIGVDGVALVTYGRMASTALDVAEHLRAGAGLSVQCVVLSALEPDVLSRAVDGIGDCADIVTLEDHTRTGGIGTMVAELLAARSSRARLHRLGLGPDVWSGLGGSEERILERSGLAVTELCDAIASIAADRHPSCS